MAASSSSSTSASASAEEDQEKGGMGIMGMGIGIGIGVGSRYENQKRRDWNTFCQYLGSQRPPVGVGECGPTHVLDFLRYLDQFGKTKVHAPCCPFFGLPSPPAPCPCPLRQAWGSLDSLVGRLRAAFDDHHHHSSSHDNPNPFGARPVRLFLREVRDFQSRSRGVSYDKKRKNRPNHPTNTPSHTHNHPPPPPPPPSLQ